MNNESTPSPQKTEKPRSTFQAASADFLFRLAAASFILGQITVFMNDGNMVFSIDCGVSSVVFLLSAIYLKLPHQPPKK